jgi:hypothetical protein
MGEQMAIGYRKYNSQISSRRKLLPLLGIYIHGAGHLRLVEQIKSMSAESIGSNVKQDAKIIRCYYTCTST